MTIQTINLGSYANDGTGDDLRTAFTKVNANFALLEADVTGAVNLGAGTGIFSDKNSTNLEFKTLTSIDDSITITHDATTVNLAASPSIVHDTNPQLGGDLDLQEHRIYNGDAQTTVYGFDIPMVTALVQLLVESNQINIDFNGGQSDLNGFSLTTGDFMPGDPRSANKDPSNASLDFNGTGNNNFLDSASVKLDIDFGTF